MDKLSKDVRTIVYKYLHYDAINRINHELLTDDNSLKLRCTLVPAMRFQNETRYTSQVGECIFQNGILIQNDCIFVVPIIKVFKFDQRM